MNIDTIIEGVKKALLPEIGEIRAELKGINSRLDEQSKRMDDFNRQLVYINQRIDETNRRIDRLYEVIVRREEHEELSQRLHKVEEEVEAIKLKIAV